MKSIDATKVEKTLEFYSQKEEKEIEKIIAKTQSMAIQVIL